ncbi:MAG: hypothetical protein PVJ27_01930 [Candidatus Brocadiaceae bacterium]|jgi:hypothetical protein
MIPPFLIVIETGRIPIVVPLILLWPLMVVALVVATAVLPLVRLQNTRPAQRAVLPLATWRALAAMRGLRVDVRPTDGKRVYIWCW